MNGHRAAEALLAALGRHLDAFIPAGGRFRCRGFRCRGFLFRRRRFRLFCCGLFPGDQAIEGLQGGIGGHCGAGDRFHPVLAEGEGAFLAHKLVRKLLVGGPLAQAFGLVRRIDAQALHLFAVQFRMDGHVAAEALFHSGHGVLIHAQLIGHGLSADDARQEQHRHSHSQQAQGDPGPLFFLEFVHSLSTFRLTPGW